MTKSARSVLLSAFLAITAMAHNLSFAEGSETVDDRFRSEGVGRAAADVLVDSGTYDQTILMLSGLLERFIDAHDKKLGVTIRRLYEKDQVAATRASTDMARRFISIEAVRSIYAKILVERFTYDELKALLEFAKSPVGVKYQALSSDQNVWSGAFAQYDWPSNDDVLSAMRQELARQFPKEKIQ